MKKHKDGEVCNAEFAGGPWCNKPKGHGGAHEHLEPAVAPMDESRLRWNRAAGHLIGRKIVGARYMTTEEAEKSCGWHRCPIVLILDDGTLLFPSSDDEGNDAGSLFVQPAKGSKIPDGFPVIYA